MKPSTSQLVIEMAIAAAFAYLLYRMFAQCFT